MLNISEIEPIAHRIPADRQGAKRHYGVHPYFTRRPANVLRAYIKHFSQPGESVLDPFGGSGVTAVEAMLLNRRGIHNDINPLANFIAEQIADLRHDDTRYIRDALYEVESRCKEELQRLPSLTEKEVRARLAAVRLPENIQLARSSDVATYHELFSPPQLLALALIKQAIDHVSDASARGSLLLAWSSTLGRLNRTFLSARGRIESRGGSSIFSIYRYKVAERPVELPPWETFFERVMKVIRGKQEVLRQKRLWERTPQGWLGGFEHYCLDIADLAAALGRKVDYIFTDPPYGGHIAYLDLSVLWNHWLGFEVPLGVRKNEIIVGGELRHTEDHYLRRLRESIRLCMSMLKPNRWISVVFEHWNTAYFEAILEEAAKSGASLKAAVTQVGDTIWSMHKKKNNEKVLAGEMILTFLKDGKGHLPSRRVSAPSIDQLVDEVLSEITPDRRPFAGEALFNRIVLKAWTMGALHALELTRESFSDLLRRKGWQYNNLRHQWRMARESVQSGYQLTF